MHADEAYTGAEPNRRNARDVIIDLLYLRCMHSTPSYGKLVEGIR